MTHDITETNVSAEYFYYCERVYVYMRACGRVCDFSLDSPFKYYIRNTNFVSIKNDCS